MWNYLPEDLLLNVLCRLPVKSLKRFNCVSKPWKALIESPELIKMHLENSSMRVLIGTAREAEDSIGLPERYCLYSAEEFGSKESFLRTRKEVCCPLDDFPLRKWGINEGIRVVGYCNGLICIQYSTYGVLVWNPWIRKHWIIPQTPVETELVPGCMRILAGCGFTYGFGYDDVNDDYKVVRMVKLLNIDSEPIGVEVKIFSMKSNLWRRIQDFPYVTWNPLRQFVAISGVLANKGALHWVVNPPNSTWYLDCIVLAIDLSTEEHRFLPIPDDVPPYYLSSFYGELCLLGKDIMWVMKDDYSWSIRIDVRRDVCLFSTKPIAFSENNRNLILQSSWEIFWLMGNRSGPAVSSPALQTGDYCDIFCSVASLVEPKFGEKKDLKGEEDASHK